MGRPNFAPNRYFRLVLVGYCDGIDSERKIALSRERTRWQRLASKSVEM
jgi:transposase